MANYLNAQGPPHSFAVLLLASHTWTVSPHQHLRISFMADFHCLTMSHIYSLSLSFQQNCIELYAIVRLISTRYSSWQSRSCGGRGNRGSFSFVSSCWRCRSALGDCDARLPTRCALTPRGGFLSTWLHATPSRPTSITHHWHGHLHREMF